jgi:replicative DNA helicase
MERRRMSEEYGDASEYDENGEPVMIGEASQYVAKMLVPGDSFILDAPDHVPSVWGRGEHVLWAEGESLILAGSPGVGKTTVGGQLVRGRLIGCDVLGLPVMPSSARVLYLAMDRPRQIARALRRTLGDLPREVLAGRRGRLVNPCTICGRWIEGATRCPECIAERREHMRTNARMRARALADRLRRARR